MSEKNILLKVFFLLIGLGTDIIVPFSTGWSPWNILAAVLKLEEIPEPPAVLIITRAFAVIVFVICAAVVYHAHSQWNGEISRRQYRMNTYEMIDSSLILDFAVFLRSFLKGNYELNKYQKIADRDAGEKSEITREMPWHIEFAKMYSIMSNQTKIDPDNDWHALQHCYISSCADKHNIAVYCSATLHSVGDVMQFLQYIFQINSSYLLVIIAVKENPDGQENFSICQVSLKIEYIFKNNALDVLLDFNEYFRTMDVLYHKPLFPEYRQKIDDIYVEPKCSIGEKTVRMNLCCVNMYSSGFWRMGRVSLLCWTISGREKLCLLPVLPIR